LIQDRFPRNSVHPLPPLAIEDDWLLGRLWKFHVLPLALAHADAAFAWIEPNVKLKVAQGVDNVAYNPPFALSTSRLARETHDAFR
jgi:hypothetical protein